MEKHICDGCGTEIMPGGIDHAITGERANGMGGGGLPSGRFDWCLGCAQRAFAAVRQARADAS
jgi:hypothetical protein